MCGLRVLLHEDGEVRLVAYRLRLYPGQEHLCTLQKVTCNLGSLRWVLSERDFEIFKAALLSVIPLKRNVILEKMCEW